MRLAATATLVLLLSGCTAGTNQAGLIDCSRLYAPNDRSRPHLDGEAMEFCRPRTYPQRREAPPPPPPPPPPAPPPA